jgi:hypothetical protein
MLKKYCIIQYGFRKNRSTADCLIILEPEMQEVFFLIAVSLDLEKAYDTAWRYNISSQHFQTLIKGKEICVSSSKTSWETELSTFRLVYSQENGVVQGEEC